MSDHFFSQDIFFIYIHRFKISPIISFIFSLYNLQGNMQKIVLALDLHDDKKCKKKVINLASSVTGIDSISLDVEKKQLTLIGTMDPLKVVSKLRKTYRADIVTVGPAKEPEKEKPKTEVVTPIVYPYVYSNPYYPQFYYEYIY